MTRSVTMIGLGEILWDVLPSGKQLGGAPANFAYMANVLGNQGVIASRIGNDELGQQMRAAIQGLGISPAYVQEDENHTTGEVSVQIDGGGQPEFEIKRDVAWDYLEWTSEWAELASRADVVCFGSLAQRSGNSRATVRQFLLEAKRALRVFDVNLRGSFYSRELIYRSFRLAHVAKLNADELVAVSDLLDIAAGSETERAMRLLMKFDLRLLCITRGANGSLLMSKDESVDHPGFRVEIADAVGAGDAFTACMAHNYVRGESLAKISEAANRFAAWVATQVGATPSIQAAELTGILDRIGSQRA